MDLTAIIAIWGALVSTVLLVIRIWEWSGKQRPRVRIVLRSGKKTETGRIIGRDEQPPTSQVKDWRLLVIEFVNVGNIPATLSAPNIEAPTGETVCEVIYSTNIPNFPVRLEPKSDRYAVYIPCPEMAAKLQSAGYSGIVYLRAVTKDSLGGQHISRKYAFDISTWSS